MQGAWKSPESYFSLEKKPKKSKTSVKKNRYQGFDFFPSLANTIALRKTDEDGHEVQS